MVAGSGLLDCNGCPRIEEDGAPKTLDKTCGDVPPEETMVGLINCNLSLGVA